jgi:hypothetical protein
MKALVVYGGWAGHEPGPVAEILAGALTEDGFDVEMSETLDTFADADKLAAQDVIVPCWTMGKLEGEQQKGLCEAVASGVGIAGVHGGMGDAFREACNYQFMVGGQFVAHPGGIQTYTVNVVDADDPIMAGLGDWEVESEQYYMHVDPSNHVLADTTVDFNGVQMPVVWKRTYEKGRVFYSALGHVAKDFDVPETLTVIRRGMVWAAEGKSQA